MSIVTTEITLVNDNDTLRAEDGLISAGEIRQVTVQSVVDTGAWTIVINEETRKKLGLRYRGYGEAAFADGEEGTYRMAGPLEVKWKNRSVICSALVLPDSPEILLGAIPLEAMDLTINPKRELVGVHGDIVKHRI